MQEEGTCALLLCLYSTELLLMDSFYAGMSEEGKCSDHWTSSDRDCDCLAL